MSNNKKYLAYLFFQFAIAVQVYGQAIVQPDLLIIGRDALPLNDNYSRDTFFFFDQSKAALRFGYVDEAQHWASEFIGFGSTAIGHQTSALGRLSFAWGERSVASGDLSTAFGIESRAIGRYATAWGTSTRAESSYTTAWGLGSIASGSQSTAWGNSTRASGTYATAWGAATQAVGSYATAAGSGTAASASAATAFGLSTVANGANSFVIGQYNDTIVPANTPISETSPLFIVGNGDFGEGNDSNAMVVRKNGTVGIGTNGGDAKLDIRGIGDVNEPHLLLVDEKASAETPRVFARLSDTTSLGANHYWEFNALSRPDNNHSLAKWNFFYRGSNKNILQLQGDGLVLLDGNVAVTSDRRLKSNISSLSDRATDLLQLGGYTYFKASSGLPEIGVIAQEVEKFFPELVIENDNGYKTVNYDGLIPVLIELIKQQEEQIKNQNSRIQKLESRF